MSNKKNKPKTVFSSEKLAEMIYPEVGPKAPSFYIGMQVQYKGEIYTLASVAPILLYSKGDVLYLPEGAKVVLPKEEKKAEKVELPEEEKKAEKVELPEEENAFPGSVDAFRDSWLPFFQSEIEERIKKLHKLYNDPLFAVLPKKFKREFEDILTNSSNFQLGVQEWEIDLWQRQADRLIEQTPKWIEGALDEMNREMEKPWS